MPSGYMAVARSTGSHLVNFSAAGLLIGTVFGSIGVGYFIYGKRQTRAIHLVCGAVLAVYPWFVSSLAWLVGIGLALVAAPFVAAWWFGV